LASLNWQELKFVRDWIKNLDHLWTEQLAGVKEAADQKAKQRAASVRRASNGKSNNQPHSKEQGHGC
jgi:hypothetical protein